MSISLSSSDEEDNEEIRPKQALSSDSDDEKPGTMDRSGSAWIGVANSSASGAQFSSTSANVSANESKDDMIQRFVMPKKRKNVFNDTEYSDFSKKMMKQMGYTEGSGLGKEHQGIAEPVKLAAQTTRRGLGNVAAGFEADEDIEWNYEADPVNTDELVDWLEYESETGDDDLEDLLSGETSIERKKLRIEDETEFCDERLLAAMLNSKTLFDEFEERLMVDARAKSNPFELIAGGIFQNRAAMKMADVDAVTRFAFSDHYLLRSSQSGAAQGEDKPQSDSQVLYFADVCAGPGGFSEYILWRRRKMGLALRTKGFGFTLIGDCDFKLAEFACGDPAFFEPYYGPHGNGDIYNAQNLTAFRQLVLKETNDKGLHFVMADGGFSVAGEENIQEIRSKRLYMCQLLVALMCLRDGGHFFCKLFDMFTPFSAALFYLAYRAFERVSLFKPVTSRPANSERYLIGFNVRKPVANMIARFLYEKNLMFDRLSDSEDINELLPLATFRADQKFHNYLTKSNDENLETQIRNLQKIRVFAKNRALRDERQRSLRDECFNKWDVPNEIRVKPKVISHPREVRDHCFSILRDIQVGHLLNECTAFEENKLRSPDRSVDLHSFRCSFISYALEKTGESRSRHYFVFGQGGGNVWVWSGGRDDWRSVDKSDHVNIELPRDTLLECEFVEETTSEGKAAHVDYAVHIIDAVRLAGVDVTALDFDARQTEIRHFCDLVNKPSEMKLSFLRPKCWCTISELQHQTSLMVSLRTKREVRPVKFMPVVTSSYDNARNLIMEITRKFDAQAGGNERATTSSASKVDRLQPRFVPTGCLFVRVVGNDWMLGWSRSRAEYYFYCPKDKRSVPLAERTKVQVIDVSFLTCLKQRMQFRFALKGTSDGPDQLVEMLRRVAPYNS